MHTCDTDLPSILHWSLILVPSTHDLVVLVDAADMIGKLNLQFNRARQGKITGELIEIITVSVRPASCYQSWIFYSVLLGKVETGRD